MTTAYDILRRPRVTEKGTRMAAKHPVVVFEVPVHANKVEIRKAVQSVFNVEVASVRTLIVRGKTKRRGKYIGKRSNWKKAIVTLADGQALDLFGGAAV
jgi:large subunit ribosomal protein L23